MRYSNKYLRTGKHGKPERSRIIRSPTYSRGQNSFVAARSTQQNTTCVGESPRRLRHRILIPAFQGSNPCSPAIKHRSAKKHAQEAANTRLNKSRVLAAFHLLTAVIDTQECSWHSRT